MTNWLLRWVVSAVALAIVANLGLGVEIKAQGSQYLLTLIEATVVIGLVNSLIRPILSLLTLPLNCMTYGLFGFVLNAILFGATQLIVPTFHVSVLGAFVGSILMGLIAGVLNAFLPDPKDR